MPVRDAITRLAAEGFVTVFPRKITRVAVFSTSEVDELFAIRSVLEAYSAYLAASTLGEDDLNKLLSFTEGMEACLQSNDFIGWFRHNEKFHLAVFERANNRTLLGILTDLWDKTLRTRAKAPLTQREYIEKRTREHKAILKAFQAKDARTIEQLWRAHIVNSRDDTKAFFASVESGNSDAQKLPSRHRHVHSSLKVLRK
jgi:DNA-binding GntR family transcriptional regulator